MAKMINREGMSHQIQLNKQLKEIREDIGYTRLFMITLMICFMMANMWIYYQGSSYSNIGDNTFQAGQGKSLQDELKKAQSNSIPSDINEIINRFSLPHILDRAQQAKPEIHFASNKTRGEIVAKVAKTIASVESYTCEQVEILNKFDVYRNCFRDLAIEFHNRLTMQIEESHWFTAVGRVQYSFLITTMQSRRNEYLITVGDIVFQALEYPHLLTTKQETYDNDELDVEINDEEFDKIKETLEKLNTTINVASKEKGVNDAK